MKTIILIIICLFSANLSAQVRDNDNCLPQNSDNLSKTNVVRFFKVDKDEQAYNYHEIIDLKNEEVKEILSSPDISKAKTCLVIDKFFKALTLNINIYEGMSFSTKNKKIYYKNKFFYNNTEIYFCNAVIDSKENIYMSFIDVPGYFMSNIELLDAIKSKRFIGKRWLYFEDSRIYLSENEGPYLTKDVVEVIKTHPEVVEYRNGEVFFDQKKIALYIPQGSYEEAKNYIFKNYRKFTKHYYKNHPLIPEHKSIIKTISCFFEDCKPFLGEPISPKK